MNSRIAKKLRREVRKTRIRAEIGFMQSVNKAGLWDRLKFAKKVIFKEFKA